MNVVPLPRLRLTLNARVLPGCATDADVIRVRGRITITGSTAAVFPPASLLVLALLAAGPVRAAEMLDVDCANLRQVSARGLDAPDAPLHEYRFAGSCRLFARAGLVTRDIRTFAVDAVGTWDRRTRRFTETVHVPGGFSIDGKPVGGTMRSEFTCSDDPLAVRTACNGFRHRNDTSLDALSNAYRQQGRSLLARRPWEIPCDAR